MRAANNLRGGFEKICEHQQFITECAVCAPKLGTSFTNRLSEKFLKIAQRLCDHRWQEDAGKGVSIGSGKTENILVNECQLCHKLIVVSRTEISR